VIEFCPSIKYSRPSTREFAYHIVANTPLMSVFDWKHCYNDAERDMSATAKSVVRKRNKN